MFSLSWGQTSMIRRCSIEDFDEIWRTINDGARAYIGVIPSDRLADPYMSREELREEIAEGVQFWAYDDGEGVKGVMGLQSVQDVTLIRHAYVRMAEQRNGIGARLLQHLRTMATGPILIGTWSAAGWAIRFYRNHGFKEVSASQKNILLKRYWNVPPRQIATSVVLVDANMQLAGADLEIDENRSPLAVS